MMILGDACSSADFEPVRGKKYNNLLAAGRSVKNVP
jgi:hypothetical protein